MSYVNIIDKTCNYFIEVHRTLAKSQRLVYYEGTLVMDKNIGYL